MPLMRPEVQAVLRKCGLDKGPAAVGEDSTLSEQLSAAGLDLSTVLENLASVANNSGNEALRLSATRDALKMHGALREQPAAASQMPSFTIIINDKGGAAAELVQGENPIFLPRQLLSQLDPAAKRQSETAN